MDGVFLHGTPDPGAPWTMALLPKAPHPVKGNFVVFTGRNEVVAKVIFLHLFVILFTGGVLPQCMLGYQPPDQTPPPPGRPPQIRHHHPPPPTGPGRPPPDQTPPPPDQADPPPIRLQHTVYERAVRILLECILVVFGLSTSKF